jgi:YHS domain-containing protein
MHSNIFFSAVVLAVFSFTSCSSEKVQQVTAAPAELGHAHPVEAATTLAGVSETSAHTLPAGAVDNDLVCMVNNAYMGRKQLPVAFEDKTYYGCCEMCVAKIQNNREVRYAQDPVTGKEVDKAEAYIVLKPGAGNGDVLYFESEETYKRYN